MAGVKDEKDKDISKFTRFLTPLVNTSVVPQHQHINALFSEASNVAWTDRLENEESI